MQIKRTITERIAITYPAYYHDGYTHLFLKNENEGIKVMGSLLDQDAVIMTFHDGLDDYDKEKFFIHGQRTSEYSFQDALQRATERIEAAFPESFKAELV